MNPKYAPNKSKIIWLANNRSLKNKMADGHYVKWKNHNLPSKFPENVEWNITEMGNKIADINV